MSKFIDGFVWALTGYYPHNQSGGGDDEYLCTKEGEEVYCEANGKRYKCNKDSKTMKCDWDSGIRKYRCKSTDYSCGTLTEEKTEELEEELTDQRYADLIKLNNKVRRIQEEQYQKEGFKSHLSFTEQDYQTKIYVKNGYNYEKALAEITKDLEDYKKKNQKKK